MAGPVLSTPTLSAVLQKLLSVSVLPSRNGVHQSMGMDRVYRAGGDLSSGQDQSPPAPKVRVILVRFHFVLYTYSYPLVW
jgi:hypothetical protein